MSGTILRVEKNQVYLQLSAAGSTGIPLANIDHIEMGAPDAVSRGLKAAEEGRTAEALSLLEPAATQFSGLPARWMEEALLQVGQCHLKLKNWAKAKERCEQFRQAYPQSVRVDLAVAGEGEALYRLNQSEAAQKTLAALVQGHENDVALTPEQNKAMGRAFLVLGLCHLARQQDEQALQDFLSTTTLYDADPEAVAEAQFQSALLFEKMNNLPRARGQLEELLQAYPASVRVADAKKKLDSLPNKPSDTKL